MNILQKFAFALLFLSVSTISYSQEIKTLFKGDSTRSHGGYGAISNKFTRINGNFANMTGLYGGWYINHQFTLGLSGSAVNSNLRVPEQYSTVPGTKMSYLYAQFGLFTEYVLASNRAVHLTAQLFAGPGFTTQYQRFDFDDEDRFDYDDDEFHDTKWFTVIEPGVNAEFNVFKWMRFTTGVSYRQTFNSNGLGMKDKDLSGLSLDAGFKFGKF